MRYRYFVQCVVMVGVLGLAGVAQSQEAPAEAEAWRLRLVALEAPYNLSEGSYFAPGMEQALGVTAGAYELVFDGIDRLSAWVTGDVAWARELMAWGLTGASVGVLGALPGFAGWLHEEGHRAVLGQRGLESHNGINDLGFGALVYVSGLSDAELSGLKASHPADFVRLQLAGDELLGVLGQRLSQDSFFFGGRAGRLGPVLFSARRQAPLQLYLWLSHLIYLEGIRSGALDEEVDERLGDEPGERERDFTGADFTAWVYDMRRPSEPWAARGGPHPSGVGVQRYILFRDLSEEEQDYLAQQELLHLINLLNPAMFNVQGFALGEEAAFTVAAHHQLTPFGFDVGVDGLVQVGAQRWMGSLRDHVYGDGHGFGVDVGLVELPVGAGLVVSPQLGGWLQPEGLRFSGEGLRPGGLVGVEVGWRALDWLSVVGAGLVKSEGFAAGVLPLGAGWTARLGVELSAPFRAR